MKPQIFPVRLIRDESKGKTLKVPHIPKGQDWRTYEHPQGEEITSKNIGVVIPEGVIVIDLDTYKGIDAATVSAMLGHDLEWDRALAQVTVSGGHHYVFRLPEGRDAPQGSDLLGISGLDTRAAGRGWICTGEGYQDMTQSGMPGAIVSDDWPELPEEVLDLLWSKDGRKDDAPKTIAAAAGIDDEHPPIQGIELEHMRRAVSLAPPEDCESYETWCKWGMALHHQTGGGNDGLELWIEMSKKSSCFDLREILDKWPTFADRSRVSKPTRFDYILSRVGGRKAIGAHRTLSAAPDTGAHPDWLRPWVYIEEDCEFFDTELKYGIKKEAFNAKFDRMQEVRSYGRGASSYALVGREIPTAARKTFWPCDDAIIKKDGLDLANMYRRQGPVPADEITPEGAKAIERLERHLALTIEDERERTLFADWMTHVYRHPDQKVVWAPVLQGGSGAGKTYFVRLMQTLIGQYVASIDCATFYGRFNSWAHGNVLVAVEEVRIQGADADDKMDRIKPYISNEFIPVERKSRDVTNVPNFASYILLTNHRDAMPISSTDRRYMVIYSRIQSVEQIHDELGGPEGAEDYFDALHDDLVEHGEQLARYFWDREISPEFSAKGRAPHTRAREAMAGVGGATERMEVEDAISALSCPVISSSVIDVTHMNRLAADKGIALPQSRPLSVALMDLGYVQTDKKRLKVKTGVHYVWYRPAETTEESAEDVVRVYHSKKD